MLPDRARYRAPPDRAGGTLRPEFRRAWARCYVRFIEAYEAEGVPIWGVSVQNEPLATQRWDSCLYTAEEERDACGS